VHIVSEECIGCGQCIPHCPSIAIALTDGVAVIDSDLCTECGTCARVGCCPTDAIQQSVKMSEARQMRSFFSDPAATHPNTGIPGRGTEEVKTNDVTLRVKPGEVGIAMEVGRPCLGTTLAEVEKLTMALAPLGISYEKCNPMTYLLESEETGRIKDEHRNERLASIIVEFTIPENRAVEVLSAIKEASKCINTVFALDFVACYDEQGCLPAQKSIAEAGFTHRPNAKINLGLGRRTLSAKSEVKD